MKQGRRGILPQSATSASLQRTIPARVSLASTTSDPHLSPSHDTTFVIRLVKILALQLKRIGDLVLTTPALTALREGLPGARITLVVADACGELLPAIPRIERGITFERGKLNGRIFWSAFINGFDACVDFTGNDRSALLTAASIARRRLTFEGVRKSRWRALAYNELVPSSVRERHTVDHYMDLAHSLVGIGRQWNLDSAAPPSPRLTPPAAAQGAAREMAGEAEFVVIHPGTARPEKYWVPERWAKVITHIQDHHKLACIIAGGNDPSERAHIDSIQNALPRPAHDLAGKMDLLTYAALLERSRACLSCDTAAVHLAAAFDKPQIALYGPINPYHWRPRHDRAIILSGANSTAPMDAFSSQYKGALMSAISTELVIRATDTLLALPAQPARGS